MNTFFQNSNSNGLGLIIFGILIYLSLYHFFLFIRLKKKYYLFYSLFALLNVFQVFGVVENVFFENFFDNINFRNSPMFFNFKTMSFMVFGLFMMSVTDAKIENPEFCRKNEISIYITLGLLFVFTFIDYIFKTELSKFLFYYIFFPLFSIVTVIAVPMMLKFKISIKYYLIFGVVTFNILTGILYFIQLKNDVVLEDKYTYLFYVAILFENIAFILALGKKEHEAHLENKKTQAKYINELQQNKILKRNINKRLKAEIKLKTKKIESLNKERLKENKKKLQVEYEHMKHRLHLESLQNQMNPHFIFNALNSIKAYLIDNDKENGIFYLNKFSKLIRGILDGMRNEEITLGKEIELLETYVKIENMRLNNELQFTFNNSSNLNLDSIYIPPLLLQPIIENAICHGLASVEGVKKITINAYSDNEKTYISITDNGIGFNRSKKEIKPLTSKSSYGLKLVEERLNHFKLKKRITPSKIKITNTSSQNSRGTHVIVCLN